MVHHASGGGLGLRSAVPDTIAALATAAGRAAVAIVRVSGPAVPEIARTILGRIPAPRHATLAEVRDQGEPVDQVLALYFPAPHSYTGEPVLELHGHGGHVPPRLVLAACCRAGARLARPGEFSERAFVNGKLDLTQAEAVADLIDSASTQAARAALRSLQGAFSRAVNALAQRLTALRVRLEAELDFAEDEVPPTPAAVVTAELSALSDTLASLLASASAGVRLRDGFQVVLVGAPNSGKSSLLNALAGHDLAIVHERAGTTRDLLRATLEIDGTALEIVDTAGDRITEDPVEAEGVRRARAAADAADFTLWLEDDVRPIAITAPSGPGLRVYTKIDLSGRAPGLADDGRAIALSAHTGAGLPELRAHLTAHLAHASSEGDFSARARHLEALRAAADCLLQTHDHSELAPPEAIADALRRTQDALAPILGRVTSDDLLGRIFAEFCIGK